VQVLVVIGGGAVEFEAHRVSEARYRKDVRVLKEGTPIFKRETLTTFDLLFNSLNLFSYFSSQDLRDFSSTAVARALVALSSIVLESIQKWWS
jgi:hypothetical protein